MVNVIWHKAASPPHTDGSVVFVRLRQCAPHLVAYIPFGIRTALSISIRPSGPVLGRPRFRPQSCPFTCGDLDPQVIHGSLVPPDSTSQTASRSVQPFLPGSRSCQTDRQTDKPRYSVCNNRPHLTNAAMRPKCVCWQHSVRKFSDSTTVRSHWSRPHNKYSLQYL